MLQLNAQHLFSFSGIITFDQGRIIREMCVAVRKVCQGENTSKWEAQFLKDEERK